MERCNQVDFARCVKIRFDKKYYKTEMTLHIYIQQCRSFELSNLTRITRISSTDYTHISLIATDEGTSSYIASKWPKSVKLFHLINYKSTTLACDRTTPKATKTLHLKHCLHPVSLLATYEGTLNNVASMWPRSA